MRRYHRAALALLTASLGGCNAQAGVAIFSASPDDVPADIRTCPRARYDGHEVFFVGNHWYFRAADGWYYFADEPQALAQWRKKEASRPDAAPRIQGVPE
jgi:hypothetical protein